MFEQRDFSFIYKYFVAEKQESLLFLVVGIVAVTLALACWFLMKSNPQFYKGAAIPLLAIGMIQVVVGYSVYSRTDKQKAHVAYNIGMEPVNYVKQTEKPRMEKVMKNFVVYRWAEIALAIAGIVLIIVFRTNPDRSFWYGLGMALAIQSIVMLGADFFAEKRGSKYVNELNRILTN